MPNKRSKRKKTQKFCCVHCQQRLWRLNGEKYSLHYKEVAEIKHHLGVSRKNAMLLAAKGACVDANAWLEEFFCGEHGKMWMLVSKQNDGQLSARPATSEHWQRTTGTVDPSLPNPSISEFSYYMSRRTHTNLIGKFKSE